MSLSDRQLDDLLGALLALTARVGKGDEKQYAAEILALRIRSAIRRDRSGSAFPDGYPTSSGSAGSSSGMPRRTVEADQHGGKESVEFTSVELAHLDREMQTRTGRDYHRELTRGVLADLQSVVRGLDDLYGKLARIDNLIDLNPNVATAIKGCTSCARYKDAAGKNPHFEHVHRGSLCQWCYGWVNDKAQNPKRQLPPLELVERRARGERITTRTIDEAKQAARKKRAS